MPSKILSMDAFPTFTGNESVPEQIHALYQYLFVMRQDLQYALQNLSADNWNATALKNMTKTSQSTLVSDLETLSNKVRELSEAMSALNTRISGLNDLNQTVTIEDDGATIGQEGKALRLVGNVYINGVLFTGEEAGT